MSPLTQTRTPDDSRDDSATPEKHLSRREAIRSSLALGFVVATPTWLASQSEPAHLPVSDSPSTEECVCVECNCECGGTNCDCKNCVDCACPNPCACTQDNQATLRDGMDSTESVKLDNSLAENDQKAELENDQQLNRDGAVITTKNAGGFGQRSRPPEVDWRAGTGPSFDH